MICISYIYKTPNSNFTSFKKNVISHLYNFIGKINMQGCIYISLNLLYVHTGTDSFEQMLSERHLLMSTFSRIVILYQHGPCA